MLSNALTLCYFYRHRKVAWFSPSKLKEVQLVKLKQIIKHAYENTSYYRGLFDSVGIKPKDISRVEDLPKIPLTSKTTLQHLPREEIIARNVDAHKCKRTVISGPSGEPLNVFFTGRDAGFLTMLWARSLVENGLTSRDKRVSIEYRLPDKKNWGQRFGIWRKELLPVQHDPLAQVSILEAMDPDVLTGYPFDLGALARAIRTTGATGIRPRLVVSIGSFLGGEQRELINSVLRTRVFDYYASGELGCIAWECDRHHGYHINADAFIVESVRNGRPVSGEEKGEIVCTALHSYALPLIRYRTGDRGALAHEPCPCDRGLPLLGSRQARANTFIATRSGRFVSPCLLVNVLKVIPGIARYKITQENKESLHVQLARGKNFSSETVNRVREELAKVLEKGVDLDVKVEEQIPLEPPGEIYSIVSKVPLNFKFAFPS